MGQTGPLPILEARLESQGSSITGVTEPCLPLKARSMEPCDGSEVKTSGVSAPACSFLSWFPGKDGVDLDAGTAASAEFGVLRFTSRALICCALEDRPQVDVVM